MSKAQESPDRSQLAAVLAFLAETPNALKRLTESLTIAEQLWRQSDDEFSALENICHLRDLELQGYTPRIERILEEDNPTLADIDGARLAAEGNYHSQDPQQALLAFQTARRANVEKLRGCSDAQLAREATLEGVGRITLRRLADMMREHDEVHLEDLRVLRQRLERL